MASFIQRIFGSGIPTERREAVLAYLVQEWKLQDLQDAEAGRYNDILTKYGGDAAPRSEGLNEIASAAQRQSQLCEELLRLHRALPVPEEAGACYIRWEQAYLTLAEWTSAAAAAYEGLNAGATPHAGRVEELRRTVQKTESDAGKETRQLLRRIGVTIEDLRRLMTESGDATSGDLAAESEAMPALDLIPLKEIEGSVGTTSLLATEPINKAWAGLTGENPMSQKHNFVVRMEMLWFFLHLVNRYAFEAGGADARAAIQDAIATNVVTNAVTSSFDISQPKEGFDAEQWQRNMISDGIEGLNDAEADYGSCKEVYGESTGAAALLSDESVVGRLGSRIAETTGQAENADLQMFIGKTAIEALAKSGLVERVAKASKAVAP